MYIAAPCMLQEMTSFFCNVEIFISQLALLPLPILIEHDA